MKRLKKWLKPPKEVDLSRNEVAEIILSFVEGRSKGYEWDDFLTFPIRDPKLDAIRKRCIDVEDDYPRTHSREWTSPEGSDVLRRMAMELSDSQGA